MLTQVLTLWWRRSVVLTALAATLSWALLVEALWNFLVDTPPHRDELHRWGVVVCSNPVDETWRIRGICIVNFPPFSSVLIETEMSSFSIFSSNSYRKKWKYCITNRLSLTFMVFIKVHIELRNKNEENVISYSQKKKIKNKFQIIAICFFPTLYLVSRYIEVDAEFI